MRPKPPGFAFAVDPVRVYFASFSGGQMSGPSFSAANSERPNNKKRGFWDTLRGFLGY
jgi:hypothetical protein